jgi:hypothetical protein
MLRPSIITTSLLLTLGLVACDMDHRSSARAEAAQPGDQTNWEREAARLLESDDCVAAQAYLDKHRAPQPLWYELMSQAHARCWQHNHAPADAKAALDVLDEGLKAFPSSANLILSKGYRHREFGDEDLAQKSFEVAEARARANLTADTPAQRKIDETVLQAAAKEVHNVPDEAVAQRLFEQDALKLIAAGDCGGAIRLLKAAPPARHTGGWFDLLYVSYQSCFQKTGNKALREEAETTLADGLRRFPSSPRLLLESAAYEETAGHISESIRQFEAALASPDFDAMFPGGRATIEARVRRLRSVKK